MKLFSIFIRLILPFSFASAKVTINTYGNTCLKPNPLTTCILIKVRDAFHAHSIAAMTSSLRDLGPHTLVTPFMVSFEPNTAEFYKLNLNSSDIRGWEVKLENVANNKCSPNQGAAVQKYHETESIDHMATVFSEPWGEEAKKIMDVDISECLNKFKD